MGGGGGERERERCRPRTRQIERKADRQAEATVIPALPHQSFGLRVLSCLSCFVSTVLRGAVWTSGVEGIRAGNAVLNADGRCRSLSVALSSYLCRWNQFTWVHRSLRQVAPAG